MPKKSRLTFPVVTLTVTALALLGFAVRSVKPHLPSDPPNKLQYESAEFLVQGSRQQVDWRPYGAEAFAEARRLEKPILLLIGAAWSALGRHADRDVFRDPDIEAFLARNMVCVRIDVQDMPQWQSAFLPIQRTRQPRDPGFQIYFLDPSGEVYFEGGTLGYGPPLNPIELLSLLQQAVAELERIRSNDPAAKSPGQEQRAAAQALLTPSSRAEPNLVMNAAAIRAAQDRTHGGFSIRGWSFLHPQAFRFMLRAGMLEDLRANLDLFVRDGHIDWLDGGFFNQVRFGGRREIDFDKLAVENADMMEFFAEAAAAFHDPLYREVADRTFRSLTEEFLDDSFAAARIGDELPGGRSRRSSVPVRDLRNIFSGTETEFIRKALGLPVGRSHIAELNFARDVLGLRSESNPMMTLRLRQPEMLLQDRPTFDAVLRRIREQRPPNANFVGKGFCDVSCATAARLVRAAVLLGDAEKIERAVSIAQAMDSFRAGEDVRRTLDGNIPKEPYLGDYLAYADLCLQLYLATGNLPALENGLNVLKRAEFRFAGDVPGIWLATARAEPFAPANTRLPEVFDYGRESTTAQAIRLCLAYSRLLRNPAARTGRMSDAGRLAQLASTAIAQFADDDEALAFSGSGYFCQALDAQADWAVFAVGHRAPQMAIAIAPSLPAVMCAPAGGIVRPDLAAKREGYYIGAGSRIEGPYTKEQAIARFGG